MEGHKEQPLIGTVVSAECLYKAQLNRIIENESVTLMPTFRDTTDLIND